MSIKYPDIFQQSLRAQSLRTQFNEYFKNNFYFDKGRIINQKVIVMKKLIENENMEIVVFPKLLKINNIEIPKTTLLPKTISSSSIDPIFLYLLYCVDLHEAFIHFNPTNKTTHDELFCEAIRDASALEETIKKIQKAGISHTRCFTAESLDWQILSGYLEKIKIDGREAIDREPIYVYRNMIHENTGMSQKSEDFKDQLFIWRLNEYTKALFKKQLHSVIATIADTLIGKGFNQINPRTEFNSENVRVLLADFKKRKIR